MNASMKCIHSNHAVLRISGCTWLWYLLCFMQLGVSMCFALVQCSSAWLTPPLHVVTKSYLYIFFSDNHSFATNCCICTLCQPKAACCRPHFRCACTCLYALYPSFLHTSSCCHRLRSIGPSPTAGTCVQTVLCMGCLQVHMGPSHHRS